MMHLRTLCAVLLIFAGVATVQANEIIQVGLIKETIVLEQRTLVLEHHTDIKDGEVGHTVYFEGALFDQNHEYVGILYGSTTSIDVTNNAGHHEVRHRELIFVVNDNQIITEGVSGYSEDVKWGKHNAEWHALDLAVTGGTGKYIGAFGTVTTKKRVDNTFVHTLHIYKPLLPQ
ncbi:MAG: hypothetical protein WAO93_05085 [Orrella sp.]|jgi:hypothetical protein|nr:hypothetical protein [Burkholderiales bacterium]